MNENLRGKDSSSIYARIEAANLPESERHGALEALATAELVVDAVTWVAKKLTEWTHCLILKPGVRN